MQKPFFLNYIESQDLTQVTGGYVRDQEIPFGLDVKATIDNDYPIVTLAYPSDSDTDFPPFDLLEE